MLFKIFKSLFYLFLIVALIAVAYWGYFYGQAVSIKEQLLLYKSLRDLSAIIFAVIGAWIAIIYPNALTNIFKNKGVEILEHQKIRILAIPMFISTGTIVISAGVEFLYPISKQIIFLKQYSKILHGASYSTVGVLFLIQIWCLLIALLPTQLITDDILVAKRQRDFDESLKPNPK